MVNIFNYFKKPLESVSDEITTKFKTPIISTFVVVWIIKNNLFLYNLFFNSSIENKTEVLKSQFNFGESDFYIRNLIIIVISLTLLIVYYVLINLSRVITMISEENIKVNLLAALKSKTIVSIEDEKFWKNRSQELNDERNKLQEELNLLRSSNKITNQELINKEKNISEYKVEVDNLKNYINKTFENIELSGKNIKENGKDVQIKSIKSSIIQKINKIENIGNPPTLIRTN